MFCQSSLFNGFGTVWSGRDIAKGAASLSFLLLLQNNLKNATKRERAFLSQEFQVIVHHTEEVHSGRSLREVPWSCPNLKKSLGSAHFLYSYNSGFLAQVMMPPTGGRSYHLVLGFFFLFLQFHTSLWHLERMPQLRKSLHHIGLWATLWGHFLIND